MKLWLTLVVAFLGIKLQALAGSYYQIQGANRSFPKSGSIEAQWNYNEKLWSLESDQQPWLYGLWRVGGFAGMHGMAGVNLDLFPLSIWQLSLQRSMTARFYETATLDCTAVQCRGLLQRNTFKTSLALGYGAFFLIPSYALTDLALDSKERDFSSEEDNLVADRSGDQVAVTQVLAGYRWRNQRWLLIHKSSLMRASRDRNSSQYLVWNKSIDAQMSFFVGAGTFSSSHVARDASVVAGLNWSGGDKLSLF